MTAESHNHANLDPRCVVRLVRQSVARCRLDLRDKIVLTEAATSAYVVTPVIAAVAGARHIYAMTRASRYGTVQEVVEQTTELARLAGVEERISIVTHIDPDLIGRCDVVTNSGHVRPIGRAMIECMKPDAVVSLMYEPWEFRPADVDVEACRDRGIRIAGTNESHPKVDVFGHLSGMALSLLASAHVAASFARIVVLCDNAFASWLRDGLTNVGARVEVVADLADAQSEMADAVLVAQTPRSTDVIAHGEAELIAARWPGAPVVQFWGDIARDALRRAGVRFMPLAAPARGHMGILPSSLGPEVVIRLQTGGLKVAEVVLRNAEPSEDDDWQYVRWLEATRAPRCVA